MDYNNSGSHDNHHHHDQNSNNNINNNNNNNVSNADKPACFEQISADELLALWHVINDVNSTASEEDTSTSRHVPSFVVIIVVSSVVVVVNAGSLMAISQVKKLNAYLRLVVSLSISDILVGVRVLFSSLEIRPFTGSNVELCAFVYLRGLKMTSHLISLFNLLGLGLDHYCAIIRPLRHRSHMSASRTNLMIVVFWAVSLLCGYSDFFVPAPSYSYCNLDRGPEMDGEGCSSNNLLDLLAIVKTINLSDFDVADDVNPYYAPPDPESYNTSTSRGNQTEYLYYDDLYSDAAEDYVLLPSGESPPEGSFGEKPGFCYRVMCSKYDPEYIVFLLAAILLIIMSFIYLRVCIRIYFMRRLLSGGRSRRVFRRNKKGLITTLIIVGTFMVCWLPFCIFTSVTVVKMALYPQSTERYYGLSVKVDKYLYALLLLNSLCDPAIYALRMREVQIGYRRLLGRCCKKYKPHSLANDGLSSSYLMTSQRAFRNQSKGAGSTRNGDVRTGRPTSPDRRANGRCPMERTRNENSRRTAENDRLSTIAHETTFSSVIIVNNGKVDGIPL